MRKDVVVRRTERWFVRQGVPELIADYRFRSHVLPRLLPFLATVVLVSVTLAVLLVRIGPEAGVVVTTLVLAAGAALLWLLVHAGRRLPVLDQVGATTVLIAFAVTPFVIPLLLIGAYGEPGHALIIGKPGVPTGQALVVTGAVLIVAFAAILVVAALATAYGVVPLAARALQHALTDMRGSLQLQGRAMPTLLFVTFFLFFTSELWQLMNHLAWARLVLVLGLFAAVTVLATSARLRSEIDRVEQDLNPDRLAAACAGTPLAALAPIATPPAPPPLSARQETNVLLVLVTRQLIQAVVVGGGLFAFFVVLGLIVVDHHVASAWILAEPERSAWIPFMPVALFKAAVLLAGFGSMYFAITTMTQAEYRREFFEPVIADVERTLAVRAVYLNQRASAAAPTGVRP